MFPLTFVTFCLLLTLVCCTNDEKEIEITAPLKKSTHESVKLASKYMKLKISTSAKQAEDFKKKNFPVIKEVVGEDREVHAVRHQKKRKQTISPSFDSNDKSRKRHLLLRRLSQEQLHESMPYEDSSVQNLITAHQQRQIASLMETLREKDISLIAKLEGKSSLPLAKKSK